ncbi:hypothetical protein AWC11_01680 [Mycobacterium interjectum]|nr:hypothetical protein AWC11_01680 [Mycobacterium interjectum]
MHYTPKIQWTDEVHRIENRLRQRLGDNPLLRNVSPWFELHILGSSCANVAYESSREFAEIWWQRMGFTWDAIREVDRWNPQAPIS